MTQTVEFDLGKVLEETNRKIDRLIEGQVRLEGKIEVLQVEVQNVKEDVREIKTELKEVRGEVKENTNQVSGLYKWVIGTLIIALLGVANILLKFFDLLPKA